VSPINSLNLLINPYIKQQINLKYYINCTVILPFAVRRYLKTRDIYQACKELGHISIKTTELYTQFSHAGLEQNLPILSKVSKIKVLDIQKGEAIHTNSNVFHLWY
tara:strand:+ start:313 stop:630 length:318 start_codon:yes stop_codon:yes gene_type:complete